MNYEAADRCHDCPQTNSSKGCPWWWEISVKEQDGSIGINKVCGKTYIPFILVDLTRSMNRIPESFETVKKTLRPLMEILDDNGEITMLRLAR